MYIYLTVMLSDISRCSVLYIVNFCITVDLTRMYASQMISFSSLFDVLLRLSHVLTEVRAFDI